MEQFAPASPLAPAVYVDADTLNMMHSLRTALLPGTSGDGVARLLTAIHRESADPASSPSELGSVPPLMAASDENLQLRCMLRHAHSITPLDSPADGAHETGVSPVAVHVDGNMSLFSYKSASGSPGSSLSSSLFISDNDVVRHADSLGLQTDASRKQQQKLETSASCESKLQAAKGDRKKHSATLRVSGLMAAATRNGHIMAALNIPVGDVSAGTLLVRAWMHAAWKTSPCLVLRHHLPMVPLGAGSHERSSCGS